MLWLRQRKTNISKNKMSGSSSKNKMSGSRC